MKHWTLPQVTKALKSISAMGWIKSSRHHDTGIGKTLEDLLHISENNIALRILSWGVRRKSLSANQPRRPYSNTCIFSTKYGCCQANKKLAINIIITASNRKILK